MGQGRPVPHFIENMRCVMSLTVDVDVTPFLDYVKANGLKFYPSMLWVVSRAIKRQAGISHGLPGQKGRSSAGILSPPTMLTFTLRRRLLPSW